MYARKLRTVETRWIFRQEVRKRDLLERLARLPATVARPMIRALTWPQEHDLQVNIYTHQTFRIFIINLMNFASSLKGKREAKKHQFPWISRYLFVIHFVCKDKHGQIGPGLARNSLRIILFCRKKLFSYVLRSEWMCDRIFECLRSKNLIIRNKGSCVLSFIDT